MTFSVNESKTTKGCIARGENAANNIAKQKHTKKN